MATGRIPINGTAAIQSTIVDAKGDIIAATGADAVSRLAVGANDTVLTADSTEATGLKWAAAASASPTSASSFVSTSQSTTSTSFTGLTTAQTVTMTTGTKVLVLLAATFESATQSQNEFISVAVSGATTRASTDDDCSASAAVNTANGGRFRMSTAVYLTCTAGSNTFTMQFKNELSNACSFSRRSMVVIDLGS
jgi:hypothetical protein